MAASTLPFFLHQERHQLVHIRLRSVVSIRHGDLTLQQCSTSRDFLQRDVIVEILLDLEADSAFLAFEAVRLVVNIALVRNSFGRSLKLPVEREEEHKNNQAASQSQQFSKPERFRAPRLRSKSNTMAFLDASTHLNKRVCLSSRPSVGPSVRPWVLVSVTRFFLHVYMLQTRQKGLPNCPKMTQNVRTNLFHKTKAKINQQSTE